MKTISDDCDMNETTTAISKDFGESMQAGVAVLFLAWGRVVNE